MAGRAIRTTASLAVLLCAGVAAAADAPYVPGATLAEEMAAVKITLPPDYLNARPRLLFGPADRAALLKKAADSKERWAPVLRQARSLGKYTPDPEMIRTGSKYWRAEYMLSGALAHLLTGEQAHRDNTVKWMIAHCAEDTWGVDYNSNFDLQAAWYLYYISLAYDILHDQLTPMERKAIRAGMISHAEAIYKSKLPPQEYRFEQNHTYIPSTALGAAALALAGETDRADVWLRLVEAMMRRARYALGEDGYYYEGTGYYTYALNWHVRYADLMARATGARYHDLPALRDCYLYALHTSLPAKPFMFDIGDTFSDPQHRPKVRKFKWSSMMYGVDAAVRTGFPRAVADRLAADGVDADDPAMYFLWTCPQVKPADLAAAAPYHHFADHDVVLWRSGWDADAACYMFKAGPPQGHAATAKLGQMKDWKMNSGHVHPDIGSFWLFAGGQYLAVDTGYTAEKFTDDHNTLLVNGRGQGNDGNYWVYRGIPYDWFDRVKIAQAHLTDAYGYACGDIAGAYRMTDTLDKLEMKRHVVMTERFMLIIDEVSPWAGYTWLLHTDNPITQAAGGFVSHKGTMRLEVYPLTPTALTSHIGPTEVVAGTAPGRGKPAERGWQLALSTPKPAGAARLAVLLAPLAEDRPAPRAVELIGAADAPILRVRVRWADRPAETVAVDLRAGRKAARRVKIEQDPPQPAAKR